MTIICSIFIIIEVIAAIGFSIYIHKMMSWNNSSNAYLHYNRNTMIRVRGVIKTMYICDAFILGWFLYDTIFHFSITYLCIAGAAFIAGLFYKRLLRKCVVILTLNRNRRIYSYKAMSEAIEKFKQKIETGELNVSFIGEADHPVQLNEDTVTGYGHIENDEDDK